MKSCPQALHAAGGAGPSLPGQFGAQSHRFNAGCSHGYCTASITTGFLRNFMTVPEVAVSISAHRSAGTRSRLSSHCHTSPCVTPIAFAKAVCPPALSTAFWIAFVVMDAILSQLVPFGNSPDSGERTSYLIALLVMKTPPTKKRPLTAEEKAMAVRMRTIIASDPGLTEEGVGAIVGVSQGQISHWTSGRLPVPAKRALKLAAALSIDDPGEISVAYRDVVSRAKAAPPGVDERRPDLMIARLENDIDALRYALGAIVTAMTAHRPAEAGDVARALRKHVPAKFVKRGYVHELLSVLEKARESRSATAPRRAEREA